MVLFQDSRPGSRATGSLLVIHHLVVDGVSWHILLEDLRAAVAGWRSSWSRAARSSSMRQSAGSASGLWRFRAACLGPAGLLALRARPGLRPPARIDHVAVRRCWRGQIGLCSVRAGEGTGPVSCWGKYRQGLSYRDQRSAAGGASPDALPVEQHGGHR